MIAKHPGVLEVCVTSIEHTVDGEWPVACVVQRPGSAVSGQEIEALVTGIYVKVLIGVVHHHPRQSTTYLLDIPRVSSKERV